MKLSKNLKVLNAFVKYCRKHSELRFWQALRSFAKVPFILTSTHFESNMFNDKFMKKYDVEVADTFYFENKNK